MKEKPISIRFEKSDLEAVTAAAKLEGLKLGTYCVHCIIVKAREEHPEAFGDKSPAKTVATD
jgi:predicted DNA binding CopG/RHH family protein